MYVRKKRNRSDSTSVVVLSKSGGKYIEIKSFSVAYVDDDIKLLCDKASTWISTFGGQQEIDFDDQHSQEVEEASREQPCVLSQSIKNTYGSITTIRVSCFPSGQRIYATSSVHRFIW